MMRILLVEDDQPIRELMRTILETHGYACAEVEHGAAAIEWLKQNSTDVVVSDCQMPLLGGVELLTWLVENRHSQLPVFIMVCANMPEDKRTLVLSLGASAVLNKPFNHNELISIIERALKTNPAI